MSQGIDAKRWAVLFLTASLFGSSFFFIKLTIGSISPLTLAAGRALLAAAVVYTAMRLAGERFPRSLASWRPLAILGLLTATIPFVAVALGQEYIESSLGGILFATIPVFTVLVAPLVLREEHFKVARFLGAAIGFAGVVLIVGPQTLAGLGEQLLGTLITLTGALSYAAGGIYARRQTELSPLVMAAGQVVTAAVLLTPLSLLFDAPLALSPTPTALVSLIMLAVVSTALPAMLLFWLVRTAGATNTSLLTFFMPGVAVVLGVAVLGETLSWATICGFGLILFGAAVVTGNLRVLKLGKV